MFRWILNRFVFSTFLGNFLSYCVGKIMLIPIPKLMRSGCFKLFSKLFGIQWREAELSLSDYKSFNDFFTRQLRSELRPISSAPIVYPCDGTITISGLLHENIALQAKSIHYQVSDLIPGCSLKSGSYTTIYLSPKDCHHVFSPISGSVSSIQLIPGHLFPVREPYLSTHTTLYTHNERLVFTVSDADSSPFYIVMVGAMNVGSMSTPLTRLIRSNRWGELAKNIPFSPPVSIQKGDLLGTFHLGSTVVLISSTPVLQNWLSGPCIIGSSPID